jgi:hypothetical protein
MNPAQLKPGTWLLIRDPLDDREYRACFIERLPSLGYGDPALNRLCCAEWIGLPWADEAGCCTYSDTLVAHHGKVLLEDTVSPLPDSFRAASQQDSKTLPAPEALDLEPLLASPGTQATAVLSGKAMEEWRERVRFEQLERLHKQLIDSQGQAQLDAQRAGGVTPAHSSTPRTPHTQSVNSLDASDTAACALRASTARSQRPHWLALSSRLATVHKARPLTLRECAMLALHPVRQWLPEPVRRLVVRTYLMASILSSCERAASKRNAKGGDHA